VKPASITRARELIVFVSVHVVVVLGQHVGEDAVKHRKHLAIGDPHSLRRRLVAVVLFGLVPRYQRRHDQIADVLTDGHTVFVSHVLELIANLVLYSDIQDGHTAYVDPTFASLPLDSRTRQFDTGSCGMVSR
jgi:hypothetical protein